MIKNLFFQAVLKVISGIILVGLMIFLPTGTFMFWNGWLFLGILFIPMMVALIVMVFKSPELLKKRLNAKEKEKEQRNIILLCGIIFVLGFIASGLEFRFGLNVISKEISIGAAVLFLIFYLIYLEVI